MAVAHQVLGRPSVRSFLLILVIGALVAFVAFQSIASAAEVDDRAARIAKLTDRRVKLDTGRRDLETKFQAKTKEIEKLKGQRSSWNRDDKLKKRLGEARDMSAALDRVAADARAVDAQLRVERAALVSAADKELAATPPPAEARRAKLTRARAEAAAKLGGKKVRVADEDVDPLDDPEDLDDKARALAQSETQLRSEEQRLGRRADYYRKQAKLAKAKSRAEEDPFNDDQPRRKTGKGDNARQAAGDDDPGVGQPAPPNDPTADDAEGGFTAEPQAEELGTDPSVVYEDVVDPSTLEELRRAERSGDPESRARAAERARKDLAARADRLRKKRLDIEKRARELRGQ